jgi:Na+-translocating ferredoxin:NAD+ oxidoreductase RnfD subunit
MSIPPATPFLPVLFALVLAVVVVRMPAEGSGIICFNAMLVGRLFLMLAYHEDVVNWAAPGAAADATTTATPLELYHSEEAVYALGRLLSGRIGGPWEDLYQIVPGSPGELFGPVIILIGCVLFWRGVLAWRTGAAFLAAFLVTCACLRQPLLFNLFSGAVLFAAVFIATDPKSTPVSKGGQLAAGCLAGIADALIRGCTNNSEGIVYSFLLVNLLSPALDRLAFRLRSRRLLSQKAAFERRQAEGAAA